MIKYLSNYPKFRVERFFWWFITAVYYAFVKLSLFLIALEIYLAFLAISDAEIASFVLTLFAISRSLYSS